MVKVQLQAARAVPGSAGPTATSVARSIIKRDGVRGLYRGMSAPLLGVTPIFAVNFWAYDVAKRMLAGMKGVPSDKQLTLAEIGVAGALSAIPTTAIMAPGERIKVLLQTSGVGSSAAASAASSASSAFSSPAPFKGPGDVVRHLLRTGGVASLFRGSSATLLRDGSGSFAYFSVYEGIKRTFTPEGQALSPAAVVVGGGLAGVCNWLVAIPFDTVKSRIQMQSGLGGGFLSTASALVREEGFRALYKGVGPALLRAFPANAACFLGMELSKSALDKVL
jgi:solute carrier family 25 carnitine/acylcarnitine transporter 20/29